MPGPAPRGRTGDAAAENARCEGCHLDVAAEWRESWHRAAHTDPMVRHQLEREPFPFCTGCHAPEADPNAPVPAALGQLGVGCVTCHLVGDRILATASPRGPGRAPSPHPVTRTLGLGASAECGACHQFAFPDAERERRPLLMQATMDEHEASAYADRTCTSCHMPLVTGQRDGAHRSHRFAASRDEAMVRSAIRVEQGPFVDDTLVLTLHPGEVGHAFPTGDVLRRLVIELDVVDAQGRSVERAARPFQRRFRFLPAPFGPARRVPAEDDRIGATGAPVVFRYAPRARPVGGQLRYTLRYERVWDPSGGPEGAAVVEGAVVLAEGALPL